MTTKKIDLKKFNIEDASSFHKIFEGIDSKNLRKLIPEDTYFVKKINKDCIYKRVGDKNDYFVLILDGVLSGEMVSISGKELKIERIESGDILAPIFLFGETKGFPINVRAEIDSVLLCIEQQVFLNFMFLNKNAMKQFLNSVSDKFSYLVEKIFFLSFNTIEKKFAYYLIKNRDKNNIVSSDMNITELAKYFSVERPSLSNVIGGFRKRNIIDYNNSKNFLILDEASLFKIVGK